MNKRLTKVLSLILTLVMFLSVTTPAFAWGGGELGGGWDREIGEGDVREFGDYEPAAEEKEEMDLFQTFDEENHIQVTVEAPMGSLPSLAEIHTELVPVEDVREAVNEAVEGEPEILLALDISFWLGNDEIEPEKPVRVKITANELEGKTGLTVVHIPEDAEPETMQLIPSDEELGFEVGANEVAFRAESFSVYAVVDNGSVDPEARIEVNFFNPLLDAEHNPVATVYVKNSDDAAEIEKIVYDPGVGETLPEGKLFRGWSLDVTGVTGIKDDAGIFVGRNYGNDTEGLTVPQIRELLENLAITEGDVLNVYAMVFNVYNVTYEDAKGIVLASDVVLMSINATTVDYTIDHSYEVTLQTEHFDGWNVKEGANYIVAGSVSVSEPPYPQGTTMKLTGSVRFSTVVSEGNWLVFEENGYSATYNAPVFVKQNEKPADKRPSLSESGSMVRPGYSFVNWYKLKQGVKIDDVPKDDNGDYVIDDTNFVLFNWNEDLTDKTTIYAKWTVADTTKYTVIVWRQSVGDDKDTADDDKTYDFAFSEEVTGVTSNALITSLDLSRYTGLDGGSITVSGTRYSFYGFKYNTTKGPVSKDTKVNPSGTTVINIYYDRELVTYLFTAYRLTAIADTEVPASFNADSPVYFIYWNGQYCPVRRSDNTYTDIYEPTTSNSGTQYGVVDGTWTTLTYRYSSSAGAYGWYYVSGGYYYKYNGTRYYHTDRQVSGVGYNYFRTSNRLNYVPYYTYQWSEIEEYTMTGLYGQKLTKYDYTYPTDYRWFIGPDSNSFISIKDMFEGSINDNPENEYVSIFYGKPEEYNTEVRHFLQDVNGTYSSSPDFTIPTAIGNGMVFRTFQGFTASTFRIKLPESARSSYYPYNYSYTTGTSYNGNNLVNPVSHTSTDGWTDWLDPGTGVEYTGNTYHELNRWAVTEGGIDFRYTRNVYNLTYMVGRFVNRNNEVLTAPIGGELKQVTGISYEGSLAAYAKTGDEYYNPDEAETPGAQTGFVFAGWYVDETCTTEALFDGTMPLDGVTVYGKWQQIEYRVFLKPNALIKGDRDTSLDWGSSSQDMNFRIAYNDKVSVPTGRRNGYDFGGWFTDEAFTHPYSADTRLTDSTVPATPVYDKTVDFTDGEGDVEMDQWGLIPDGATPINKDVNRPWITRKLVLYARWSQVIVGANGIGVLYDSNGGGNAPRDPLLYKDNIYAIAQAATTAPSNDLTFDCWVMQKWDEGQGKYVDIEGSRVYPGDSYLVLLENAKKAANPDNTPDNPSYTYTIQLRANYVNKDKPDPTHITWHANNNTGDKIDSAEVDINENIEIPIPQAELDRTESVYYGWDELVWEDHVFLGWARLEETAGMPETIELGEEDLFLRYNSEDKTFSALVTPGSGETPEEETQYYLVGFFGADNENNGSDYNDLGYPFVNGKLTVSFVKDSYLAVRTRDGGDVSQWFMTDGWQGTETTSAVLGQGYGTNANKLFVPGGTLLNLSLVDNGDGTLTLSYTKGLQAGVTSVSNLLAEGDPSGETEPEWRVVNYVAADENLPYNTMYAVWAKVFYVYHTGTNVIEKVIINETTMTEVEGVSTRTPITVDLASRTSPGFLYGGLYTAYAGVSTGFDIKTFAWGDPVATDSMHTLQPQADKNWFFTGVDANADPEKAPLPYDGSNVTFLETNALKSTDEDGVDLDGGNGLALKPVAGMTYYIKEVPADKYLRPYFHYTYHIDSNVISSAWLISDTDDTNYQQTGFAIVNANGVAEPLVSSLTVKTQNGNNTIKLTAKRVFGAPGYLSYLEVMKGQQIVAPQEGQTLNVFGNNSIVQYWQTPDGLFVTSAVARTFSGVTSGNTVRTDVEASNADAVSQILVKISDYRVG